MFTTLFWKDAVERFVKTFAQALLALLVVAPQTPFLAFDWASAIGLAVTAAVISLLTSIVSGVVTSNTPTVSPASIAPDSRGIK
jgi:hypothetical protein